MTREQHADVVFPGREPFVHHTTVRSPTVISDEVVPPASATSGLLATLRFTESTLSAYGAHRVREASEAVHKGSGIGQPGGATTFSLRSFSRVQSRGVDPS